MKLQELQLRNFSPQRKGLVKEYSLLEELIIELQDRELPPEVVVELNMEIAHLNAIVEDHKKLFKALKRVKKNVLKILHDDLGLVPKNYYRNFGLAIGMSVIGVPIGVLLSELLNDYSYVAFGFLLGMIAGLAIGNLFDKNALENNQQLQLEIN